MDKIKKPSERPASTEANSTCRFQLIPVRHGRTTQSPFTWYRGAALSMAADLDPNARDVRE